MTERTCRECSIPISHTLSGRICHRCRGKKDRRRERASIEAKSRSMAIKARNRASKKNLPCEIDALWIVTRWYEQHGRCHFSGRPMTLTPGPLCVSLDRLNSSKGYTRKNTVLAALRANSMKSDLGVGEFIEWCEDVTQHHQKVSRSAKACRGRSGESSPAGATPCSAGSRESPPEQRDAPAEDTTPSPDSWTH